MQPFPTVTHIGGRQPDVAATANLLRNADIVGPTGTEPITEAMAFGLAGGVGFLYGVFEYDDTPTMTIVARNRSMPDPFLEPVFDHLDIDATIETTGGAATAARRIEAHLALEAPMLCTVGAGYLPYLGLPLGEAAMSPHVVGVIGGDENNLLIDDRSPAPHVVDRAAFAEAHSAYRNAKHRTITLAPFDGELDWPTIVRKAVADGVAGYDTPPVPQFASNVGLAGLRKWSELLAATKGPKRWSKIFASDRRAAIGLTRLHDCLNHAYTTVDAGRPLYAEFLREAAAAVSDDRYIDAAEVFEASAGRWNRVSELVVSVDPAVERHAECSAERARAMADVPDPKKMAALTQEQGELVAAATIDETVATDAYHEIAKTVDEIIELETEALALLKPQ